jgi:phosphatidylserine synthase
MPFKFKDILTLGNLLAGFISIIFALEGEVLWGCYAIIGGYIFDCIDGYIARVLGGSNRFGAEFDNIADFMTYSVAPGFLFFSAYKGLGLSRFGWLIILFVSSLPIITGAIRFARFNIKRIEYPGIWFGLPRPASCMIIITFLASHLFEEEFIRFLGIPLVIFLGVMNLGLFPFVGHHKRVFPVWLKFVLAGIIITTILAIPFSLFWDVAFFWTLMYPLTQWIIISKEERREIREFVREWKKG